MALIFQDLFTGSDGTAITSHTPDTGTGWTEVYNSGSTVLEIDTNSAAPSGLSIGNGFIYSADATYDTADYRVKTTAVTADSGDDVSYLMARMTDQDNFYWVRFNQDVLSVGKKVSGTFTTLSTSDLDAPQDGDDIEFVVSGSTLSVEVESVEVISTTDTSITDIGKAGIGMGGGAELLDSGDDLSQQQLDNFEVNTGTSYYFDGSDTAANDPDTVWTNETNLDDGDTSTNASISTNGSDTSNYSLVGGTNAPSSGGTISQVELRVYASGDGFFKPSLEIAVYTSSKAELLSTITNGTYAGGPTRWTAYQTVSAPTGGWTWSDIQGLEAYTYMTGGSSSTINVYKIEILVTSAPASGQTATPSTASLTITEYAPTVVATASAEATPTTASLSITSYAPNVTATDLQEVIPSTTALTTTTYAPTVSATDFKTATPTTASLSITEYAPTVTATANVEVTPNTASLTITNQAPTVTTGDAQEVSPGVIALTITTSSPTVNVTANVAVTPQTTATTITTHAPTVNATANVEAEPTTATLSITGYAPEISSSSSVLLTPGTATITTTTYAPTATATANVLVTPNTLSLTLSNYAPNVESFIPTGEYTNPVTVTEQQNIGIIIQRETSSVDVTEVSQSIQVSSTPTTNITITEEKPTPIG